MDPSFIAATIGGVIAILAALLGAATNLYAERNNLKNVNLVVKQVAVAKTADIQQIAASQLELNNAYYKGVLQQSRISFIVAVVLAGAGLILFGLVTIHPENSLAISTIGGTVTEILSGFNFYLYGRASAQLELFHSRLDKLQFFVLANSMCENLDDSLKYQTRAELVLAVADFIVTNKTTNSLPKARKKQLKKITNAEKNHDDKEQNS